MADPSSPTGVDASGVRVVTFDEQTEQAIDASRWADLARRTLLDHGVSGELTLGFVGADRIAELNAEHLGGEGPTDVLSFPLDTEGAPTPLGVPVLLGDVVICPEVAALQAPTHAGSLDDELALLTVHGVLHVLGHDHADPDDAAEMRRLERDHLERHHWRGPAPGRFRHTHPDDASAVEVER